MNTIDTLRSFGACDDALEWAEDRPEQSPNGLWLECHRADWLLWYMGKLAARDGHGSKVHRRAVLIACLCARIASIHWRDPSCERAVSLAERWAWGDRSVTCGELHAAAAAVEYANAAHSAAASAAATAGDAAAAAVEYANAAYSAAADCSSRNAAAREARLASLADLIRAAIPEVPL